MGAQVPELRRPTDRAIAWQPWRDMLAGHHVPVTPDQPLCGWFKAKRRGQWCAVQIDLIADTDPDTGELVSEESYVAFVGADAFYERAKVDEIWLRCAGNPISEQEAERLLRMPAVADLTRQVVV